MKPKPKIHVLEPERPREAESRQRLSRCRTLGLLIILAYGTMTVWVPQRWALSVLEAALLGAAAVWALATALHPVPIRGSILLAPLGATVLWGLVSAAGWTVYRHETWEAVVHWSAVFAVFLLGLQLLSDGGERRAFLRGFLYFGFAVSVIAVLQFHSSQGKFLWLFSSPYPDLLGPFQNRNNFAAFVELLVPVALWEALNDRRNRTIYLAMAAVLVAAVIASASRAGTVLVCAEVIAVLVISKVRGILARKDLLATTAWTLSLVAVFVLVAGWEGLWHRLQDPDPFAFRRDIHASTLAMIADRPWTGFGMGTYQTVYPAFAVFDIGRVVNHAHNDWIEWTAEGGVPLLVLLLPVAIWSIRPAFRSVWGLGIVAVFAHALVDYPLQRLGVAAWVFVLLAALAAAERDRRAGQGSQPLITPIGQSRATLRARPARSTTSMTLSTFL